MANQYAYKPYTTGPQRFPHAGAGYAPGGVNYYHPATAPAPPPRYYTGPRQGYAPGGVLYKALPTLLARNTGPQPPAISDTTPPPGYVPPAEPAAAPDPNNPFPNDPVYQQIIGLANQNVAQAQASADASRKQLAIQLGDPGLATSLGLGDLVAQTAQANPFSTLKNLLRGHNQNVNTIDQSLNRANLFSSSTRDQRQKQEGTGYLSNIAGAGANAQSQLGQILAILLAAQQNAAVMKANAAADAAKNPANAPPEPGTGYDPTPDTPYTQADAYAALLAASMSKPKTATTGGGGV